MISHVIRLPPVIAFSCLIAGLAAHRFVPLSLGVPSFEVGMGIGCALLLGGVAIARAALSELKDHRTTA